MRRLFLAASLLLTLASASAGAEVVAVCGTPAAGLLSPAALQSAPDAEGAPSVPLALWRDANGFDLLLNWGEQSQHSLRAEGADIMGNELGSELIHLVVVRPGAHGLEHFVFSFADDAPGEMVWNAPGDAAASSDQVLSYETTCFKAK